MHLTATGWLLTVLACVVLARSANAYTEPVDFLYCERNCYAILEVEPTASLVEIKKAYRRLSLKYHPDKNPAPDATTRFQEIANAHEVLSHPDTRAAYDDLLANPELYFRHYARFYRYKVLPKTDLRILLSVIVIVVSAGQYLHRKSVYEHRLKACQRTDAYKYRVQRVLDEMGYDSTLYTKSKLWTNTYREGVSKAEAAVEVTLVGLTPAKWKNVLAVQLVLLPYLLVAWLTSWMRWTWKFRIRGDPYGQEEKIHLTCKALNLSRGWWNEIPHPSQEELLARELWIPQHLEAYREEVKRNQEPTARQKRYQRWLRHREAPSINFNE